MRPKLENEMTMTKTAAFDALGGYELSNPRIMPAAWKDDEQVAALQLFKHLFQDLSFNTYDHPNLEEWSKKPSFPGWLAALRNILEKQNGIFEAIVSIENENGDGARDSYPHSCRFKVVRADLATGELHAVPFELR